jgi:ABC-type transporter Mla subunit MlaD
MRTQKSAMNKVAKINKNKTELNAHRLNLSLQADINKVVDEMDDSFGLLEEQQQELDDLALKLRNIKGDFDKLVNDTEGDIRSAQADLQQGKSIEAKVKQAAKDLGVDPDGVKGFDLLQVAINDLEEQIKFTPKFIQQLK